jgi:predicted aspartyl protease
MGITYIEGKVRSPTGRERAVRLLVDSGASYTLLPATVWKAIGLKPKRKLEFALADGSVISRGISECLIILPQGEGHTPVVLGEPGDDQALLGVVTLENLGLVFNPFSRTLQPMRLLLA